MPKSEHEQRADFQAALVEWFELLNQLPPIDVDEESEETDQ